jgi:chromosome segregation ATPase
MRRPTYFLALLLLLGSTWTSVRADDFEAEAEDVMLESDATSEAAKQAKDRAAREKQELDKAKREAEGMKMRAEIRKRHSGEELADAEKEERALRAERDKNVKMKIAAEKEIAVMEAKLKAGLEKRNKTKGELEAIKQLREEQKKKISDLNKQIIETKAANKNLVEEVAAAKAEYEKGRIEDKKAQSELEKAKVDSAKKKQQLETQIQQWKSQYKASKDRTAASEAQARQIQMDLAKKEEQAKYAESEVKAQMNREAAVPHRSAASANHYTLSKECSVYEKPDMASKVLGKKKAGSSFSGEASGEFVGFRLKDHRTVYVSKSCF